jgi:hypothetical protein
MDGVQIALIVVSVISAVFGVRWRHFKVLLKELAEAITAVSSAVEDDKISVAEAQKVLKEVRDVISAARKLLGR